MKKPIKDNNKEYYNKTQKKRFNRYDKNKCIIERKIYAGEKKKKKNNYSKNVENITLPDNCNYIYNKIIFNIINLNINKELNLNAFKQSDKNIINITNITNNSNNLNIYEHNHNISNRQSNKLLIKSKTNNILNTSLEDLTEKSNEINNINNKNKNNKNKDIQLIFPSIIKNDFNNDSSQESTNQIISTYSNKMTINNTNMGYRKEKFISSFLDGPEDIHYRFVDLHKQRKLFYENLCNKLEENKNSIDINKQDMNDFEKSEYSEYFDNYNEDVPFI